MSIMYIEQLSKAMYTVATIGTKSHKIKNDSKKSVQKKTYWTIIHLSPFFQA